MLPAEDLSKVQDFVDDDLLSCFLWAAGENAVAQPGWESPSVNPLKGIPLPPAMPPLPPPDVGPSATTGGSRAARAAADDEDDGEEDDLRGGNPNLSKEQKLTQRMQRKAESARVARLRKKEYVNGLEQEVANLKAEVAALREKASNGIGQSAGDTLPGPPSLKEEGQRHRASMEALLQQSALETTPGATEATVEKYVANKRAQQETINEYLDCIEDILSPGTPLQVAFSASGEGFADEDEDPDPKRQRRHSVGSQLLETLSLELGLSTEQVGELSGQKDSIQSDRELKGKISTLIQELRRHVGQHISSSQSITDGLRRILTPHQVAKFLVWVERNQRSMDMLNTMFSEDVE